MGSCCGSSTTKIKVNQSIQEKGESASKGNAFSEKTSRFMITKNFNYDGLGLKSLDFLDNLNGDKIEAKVLSAESNRLISLPEKFLSKSLGLKKLSLRSNLIASLPAVISSLSSLETIDLAENKLNSLSLHALDFSALQSLIILDISNNMISTLPESIKTARRLEVLKVNHNSLEVFPCRVVSQMERLDEFHVSRNQIRQFEGAQWSNSRLRLVDLGFNKLGEIPAEIFRDSAVSSLNLKGNPIKLEQLKNVDGYERIIERRRASKDKGFRSNLDINFDLFGLD